MLSICVVFCQFQLGVAYKSFAYRKKSVHMINDIENEAENEKKKKKNHIDAT